MNNEKIRILYFYMKGGTAGGSDTCLYFLLKYLDKSKFDVFLMYNNDSKFVSDLKNENIKLINVSIPEKKTKSKNIGKKIMKNNKLHLLLSSLKKTIKRLPLAFKYSKLISEYNIDLVHTNHYLSGNDRPMIIASLLKRKPIISHNRGLYKPDSIDRFIAKFINKFICMSDFSKSVYTENGISEAKCETIYDGIDPAVFNPLNIKSDEIIVGCFGRLDRWKGQQTLIDAAEIIIKTNSNIKFRIVGNGADEDKLKNSVKEKELADYVEFTGHITNVKEYMNKCSIIAHTSTEPEPFGMVIIEAMALEKPVIATNIGGPLEIINDGEDGFLIPPKEPKLLAEKILDLLNDPKHCDAIGKNARKKVESKFNVKDYVKHIGDVYNKI